MNTYTYINACMHTYIHAYMHACMHACMCSSYRSHARTYTFARARAHTHTHTHTQASALVKRLDRDALAKKRLFDLAVTSK